MAMNAMKELKEEVITEFLRKRMAIQGMKARITASRVSKNLSLNLILIKSITRKIPKMFTQKNQFSKKSEDKNEPTPTPIKIAVAT